MAIGSLAHFKDAHFESQSAARTSFDVSGDGQRFLITVPVEGSSAPITVVMNWTADLKR